MIYTLSGEMNMEVMELINRFLEETNFQEKPDLMLLMAYGSRVTGNNHENSDLDILYITSKSREYRGCRLVDGIPVDITIIPINDAEEMIMESSSNGSVYLKSVLKTGLVIIDKYGTFDMLSQALSFEKVQKRTLDGTLLDLAVNHFFDFEERRGNENIHYYAALDLLRRAYHAKKGCSNISTSKVYELYCDREKAKKYMLKLPDDIFLKDYLSALQERDYEKRKELLVRFLKLFQNERVKRNDNDSFLDDFWITKNLVTMNNAIWKCEDMALQNNPYAIPLYYMLMDKMQSLYGKIYSRTLEFDFDFSDSEQLIRNLESFFCHLDSKKEIDYQDYLILW